MYRLNPTKPPLAPAGAALIVGVGALGCPAAITLAEAGLGRLTLIDPDTVETSNLQRQILFDERHVGLPKAPTAAAVLREHGARCEIRAVVGRVTPADAAGMIAGHDVVIDACDDPATKFTLNRACVDSGVTYCYGGVVRTGGQMLVVAPGRSACLACVFPEDEASSESEGCSSMGILAPVAGVIGSLQAYAAVRCLTGDTDAVAGRMSIYELRGTRWRSVAFERRRSCAVCGDAARPHEPRRFETCPS